jgi:hypothetical protein
LAAAEHRAAAAEHRAEAAERRLDDGDTYDAGRSTVVREKPTYGLGSLLALLGGLAIALSTFLLWGKEEVFDGDELAGTKVSFQLLWDTVPTRFDEQPTLLFLLLPAAILAVVGAFIPRLRVLAIIGGALAVAAAVLFLINVGRISSEFDLDVGAFSGIGLGVWFAAIGGIVAIIGALMIPRRAVVR